MPAASRAGGQGGATRCCGRSPWAPAATRHELDLVTGRTARVSWDPLFDTDPYLRTVSPEQPAFGADRVPDPAPGVKALRFAPPSGRRPALTPAPWVV